MQAKLFALIAAAAFGSIVVTGCSKSADSSSSSDSSASSAPASAASSDASNGSSMASTTVAAAGDPAKGESIFAANCASCHGEKGAGGGIGPTLKGEKARKNTSAAIAWIKNPQPPMPKLYPSPLSEKDVADVASYVESL